MLLLPLQQAKALHVDVTKVLLWGSIGALTAIPVGIVINYFVAQKRLANRTDNQVLADAREYINNINQLYKFDIELVKSMNPNLKELEHKALEQDLLKKATAKFSSARYPLIIYEQSLDEIHTTLKKHEKWVIERLTKQHTAPSADQSFIEQANELIIDITKKIEQFSAIREVIITSYSYTHEVMMKRADDTRPYYYHHYTYPSYVYY